MKVDPFGPKNEHEAEVFAVESFRVDVQQHIHNLMTGKGVSRKELATRLRITEAQVDGFFEDDTKIDLRRLAQIFHALGAKVWIGYGARDGGAWVSQGSESLSPL